MSKPEFVLADPSLPAWRSPLRRALERAPTGIRDASAEAPDGPLGPAAGIAGIEVEASFARALLARLTDLDLDALPAIGAVAHVRTQVTHEGVDRYRLWFPQEFSDYLARVVIDTWGGLTG